MAPQSTEKKIAADLAVTQPPTTTNEIHKAAIVQAVLLALKHLDVGPSHPKWEAIWHDVGIAIETASAIIPLI